MAGRLSIRARINARVKAGGHFVPPEDVKRRYARSKANFVEHYMKAVDQWVLCYNGDMPVVVAERQPKSEIAVYSRELLARFREDHQ